MTRAATGRRLLAALLVGAGITAAGGCGFVGQGRQVEDNILMLNIVSEIKGFERRTGRVPSAQELFTLLPEWPRRDSWGHPVLYEVIRDGDRDRYVVAIVGQDGTLDVPEMKDYLTAAYENVGDQYDRDQVVVDGEDVRIGGK